MYKLLHFADLHLDVSFAGIGFPSRIARKYRENLRQTLVRILDLAVREKVQAITIAGDLYENERFTRDTGEFLLGQFKRVSPVKVFIAPGNHDPFVPESLYRFLKWPENVTIFSSADFSPVQLAPDLTLWGLAHLTPSLRKNPLEKFLVPEEGRHILLFHGSDTSSVPEGKTAHAPFVLADLIQTGADLALLGHYHGGNQKSIDDKVAFYPGSPDPLGFAETGEHTAGLISIGEDSIDVRPVPVSSYNFETIELNVTGLLSRDEIKIRLEERLKSVEPSGVFLRVKLVGTLEAQVDPEPEILNEIVRGACEFGFVTDQTRPGFDYDSIAQEKTVRGEFVRDLLQKIETTTSDEKKLLEETLRCGLLAFEGREIVKL